MNFTFTYLAYDYLKASSNIQHISFNKSHKINVIHCIILKDIFNFSRIQAVKIWDYKVIIGTKVMIMQVNIVYYI